MLSEVPIWKPLHRAGFNGADPLLQGWAIVVRTVGDWNKVELSLVAGAPQSFIQNLSQPYWRPVVPLPGAMTHHAPGLRTR